jgi:purine-binding chemotaxis protein CheW
MGHIATTAKKLPAIPGKNQNAAGGQYLSFMLGEEVYALGLLNIKEIIEYGNLIEVPMLPDFVRGVINLRGDVVPVIDLKIRFGKGSTTIAKRTGIVIVETKAESETQQVIGIIVDAVNEVIEISQEDIALPPGFGTPICPDFINGMAKSNNSFIILLDPNRVLSLDELADLSKITADIMEHNES